MKEINPEKGLNDPEYTEQEFDVAFAARKQQDAVSAVVDAAEAGTLSDEDFKQITIITLMRIYDVLGMLLNHFDPEAAEATAAAHDEGGIVGPEPKLNL